MTGQTNTKRTWWKSIQTNLLFVGLVELLIYNGGLLIKYIFQGSIDFFSPVVGPDLGLYYNANFWIACGFHTGWNYVQEFLFGISNSGTPSNVGLFQGALNYDSIFYQKVYGYEGALTTTILMAVIIGYLIFRLRKRGVLQDNVIRES